ncbi:MAG TPA: hypothetical protein VHW04_15240, partial [Solirubrobacteraceae bacterium]|nr:hypothetical protein [Solirubrobacteraceae bacterium]
ACDIAPMASVNGEYVGPLQTDDAARIVEDLRTGRPVLPEKQIRYRRTVDTGQPVPDGPVQEFGAPDEPHGADTAGLAATEADADRPGPSAPIEIPPERPRDENT